MTVDVGKNQDTVCGMTKRGIYRHVYDRVRYAQYALSCLFARVRKEDELAAPAPTAAINS